MKKLTRRIGLATGAALLFAAGAMNGCGSDSSGSSSGSTTKDSGGNDTGSSGSSSGAVDSSPPADTGTSSSGDTGAKLTASATLAPLDDAGTTGTAKFVQQNGVTSVALTIANGVPGTHGLHVHNGTDCVAPGPHYGPDGGPYHGEYKITVDEAGVGTLTVPTTDVTVGAGQWSVVGHAIVYHKLATPPVDAGADADAGPPAPAPRQACGVIATP